MKHLIQLIFLVWLSASIQAQSLENLVQEAIVNNPTLKKLDYQYQIALEKINEVNTLPNTAFSFAFMAVRPEMEMPMKRFSVSAMQMLPWFGTIDAKKQYASSMAEAQHAEISVAQKKLIRSISQIYYQLYALEAKKLILAENMQLLKTYEKLALSSVKVAKASPVDVMRIQIRQNEMQQEIDVLDEQFKGLEAAMNSLINRDLHTPIAINPNLNLPKQNEIWSRHPLDSHPELVKLDKIESTIEYMDQVNQKERNPMIGVGIEYINQDDSPMITSSYKDMVMPMVSVSIPIFNHKFSSITIQNQLKREEVASQKQEKLNDLNAQLSEAIAHSNQAIIKYNALEENISIAKNAEKLLLKNYETGTIDYDEVLNIQELQLKFQKAQIEAIKTYYNQQAIIAYLAATNL